MSIWTPHNHKEVLCIQCKKVKTFQRDGICVICRRFTDILENSQPLDPEIATIINENFGKLI